MNFNLPYILQNGMKILNIVNKTLPLVKEFNPALNYIQKKLKSSASPLINQMQKNTPILNDKPRINNNINKSVTSKSTGNNTLTFFR